MRLRKIGDRKGGILAYRYLPLLCEESPRLPAADLGRQGCSTMTAFAQLWAFCATLAENSRFFPSFSPHKVCATMLRDYGETVAEASSSDLG